jgi:5-methyltetrahydrofolate--homocysteine methyltransferase
MVDIKHLQETMIAGEIDELEALINTALSDGEDPAVLLNEVLVPGMDIVGQRMETGDLFIPEVLMAAQAMSNAVEILKPLLGDEGEKKLGTVAIGTVKGDLHDIGKNLVCMMMESTGFKMIDLGTDVSPEKFVETIEKENCDIVALSALLTTTMGMIKRTVEAITESGYRDRVKIIIGGAPVTQKYSDEIGADGYAEDAGTASKLAKALLK